MATRNRERFPGEGLIPYWLRGPEGQPYGKQTPGQPMPIRMRQESLPDIQMAQGDIASRTDPRTGIQLQGGVIAPQSMYTPESFVPTYNEQGMSGATQIQNVPGQPMLPNQGTFTAPQPIVPQTQAATNMVEDAVPPAEPAPIRMVGYGIDDSGLSWAKLSDGREARGMQADAWASRSGFGQTPQQFVQADAVRDAEGTVTRPAQRIVEPTPISMEQRRPNYSFRPASQEDIKRFEGVKQKAAESRFPRRAEKQAREDKLIDRAEAMQREQMASQERVAGAEQKQAALGLEQKQAQELESFIGKENVKRMFAKEAQAADTIAKIPGVTKKITTTAMADSAARANWDKMGKDDRGIAIRRGIQGMIRIRLAAAAQSGTLDDKFISEFTDSLSELMKKKPGEIEAILKKAKEFEADII